jgi:urease accessory protein
MLSSSPLALLLLADGRFPAGGHAHSAGAEAAVVDRRVTDVNSLAAFVAGRVRSVGLTDAALAAAAARRVAESSGELPRVLRALDAEAEARIAPPPLRTSSRRLGRQLARTAARCWPSPVLAALVDVAPGGAHQPVALGAVGVAAGIGPTDVARLSLHHAAATPAQAALRLLGLDPYAVAALIADLAPVLDAVAADALAAADGPLADLPARAGPACELAAVEHATRELRMFVS